MNYCLKQALLAILFVAEASAATLYPSDPVFVLGPQGRPIPNAVMTFQDSITGLPVQVYTDGSGTVVFGPELPSTGLVQFWAQIGRYYVTVSGAGYTRTFYVVVVPSISSSDLIWIDRDAEDISITTGTNTTLNCFPPALCFLTVGENDVFRLDFVAPSFPVSFEELSISWTTTTGGGDQMGWTLYFCKYAVGQPECAPVPVTNILSTVVGSTLRQDTSFVANAATSVVTWNPRDHVIFEIQRAGSSNQIDPAMIYNLDLTVRRR